MQKIFKKTALAAVITGSVLGSTAALAEMSANIGIVSNYFYRGVTQTADGAAVQGGIDYEHGSGFYAGTWASNVDFGDGTSYEIDFYAGFGGEAAGIGYDIGYVYYAYPDAGTPAAPADIDFGELYASASFSVVTLGLAYTINSDGDEDQGNAFVEGDLYYYLAADFELSDGWGVGASVGQYTFNDDGLAESGGSGSFIEDYSDIAAYVSKSTDMGDFSLNLAKTDGDTTNFVAGDDDPKLWLGYSVGF